METSTFTRKNSYSCLDSIKVSLVLLPLLYLALNFFHPRVYVLHDDLLLLSLIGPLLFVAIFRSFFETFSLKGDSLRISLMRGKGIPIYISVNEINEVEKVSLLGLQYLRLRTSNGKKFLLAWPVQQTQSLKHFCESHLSPDHPLAQYVLKSID